MLRNVTRFATSSIRAFFIALFSPDPSFAVSLDERLRTPKYGELDTPSKESASNAAPS